MTTNQTILSKRITEALAARQEEAQWESFIATMLEKLELSPEQRDKAVERYKGLAQHVAGKLGIGEVDVHIVVQGSMRTQTTTAMWGNTKFDLDIVVKLSSARFIVLRESEEFFQAFGRALQGIPGAGEPEPKNRCWRLRYPGEPFYFDVTPAIPLSADITGTDLRVRDPRTKWSPSNPEGVCRLVLQDRGGAFPFSTAAGRQLQRGPGAGGPRAYRTGWYRRHSAPHRSAAQAPPRQLLPRPARVSSGGDAHLGDLGDLGDFDLPRATYQ